MFTSTIRLFIPPRPAPDPADVPLAVWTSPLNGTHDDPSAAPWLTQLAAAYTPDGQQALLYTPDQRHMPDPLAGESPANAEQSDAEPTGPAGLVIAQLQHLPLTADEFDRHVSAAAAAVCSGGWLAVVTRDSHRPRRRRHDPVSLTVDSATRLGFGFVQHLIITDPDQLAAMSPAPSRRRRSSLPTHRPAHLDVGLFKAPATAGDWAAGECR